MTNKKLNKTSSKSSGAHTLTHITIVHTHTQPHTYSNQQSTENTEQQKNTYFQFHSTLTTEINNKKNWESSTKKGERETKKNKMYSEKWSEAEEKIFILIVFIVCLLSSSSSSFSLRRVYVGCLGSLLFTFAFILWLEASNAIKCILFAPTMCISKQRYVMRTTTTTKVRRKKIIFFLFPLRCSLASVLAFRYDLI